MKEELLKGLTKEQIAKVKECKTQEEILALAKTEGIELTDEQLETVSGGCGTEIIECPKCHGEAHRVGNAWEGYGYECSKCGNTFSRY